MEAQSNQAGWIGVARVVLQVAILLTFLLTSVRLLLTRGFIRFEYAIPGFPADPYGFTKTDRIHYADIALDYLLNDEGIEFLGELELENGSPAYGARELRHMQDVKQVTQAALRVWLGAGLVAVALGLLLWQAAGLAELTQALVGGARLTALVMALLLVGLLIGFSVVFVGFHRVFFEGNTWLFNYSDTLIRLFPELFWQVAFATISVGTLTQSGVLYVVARWLEGRAS